MLDKPVGEPHAKDGAGHQPGVIDRLEDRRTESGGEGILLDRDRPGTGLDQFQDRRIERLHEPGIDDRHFDPLEGESAGCRQGRTEQGAAGNQQPVVTATEYLAAAPFDGRPGPGVVVDGGLGIADRHRTGLLERPVEHRDEVVLVARCEDGHVGEQPHVPQIVGAVVGRAVGAGEPCPVEHEGDREILQRDFLKDLVERPLEKGAVDVDDRPTTGLGLSGGKRHGVRLADADVEEPVWEFLAHRLEFVPLAHRGGDHRDAGIAPQAGADCGACDVGVGPG